MISFSDIRLDYGSHETREDGTCFLEAAAWLAGEDHNDHPACVCRVLGLFVRAWNDGLPDGDRQKLVPYLRLVLGTANDGFIARRALMCADWLIRVHAPGFLRLTPSLEKHAEILANLDEVRTFEDLGSLGAAPRAAWDAARNAASAAGATARDAAWGAARSAARNAALEAANGSGFATEATVAAVTRASAAAVAAAEAAAVAAVEPALKGGSGAAAWWGANKAAREALWPTVEKLQLSAFQLVDRMLLLGLESRQMPDVVVPGERELAVAAAIYEDERVQVGVGHLRA